jgi:hypothetical protein
VTQRRDEMAVKERRITVTVRGRIGDADALIHIAKVMQGGRISSVGNKKCYCFATKFKDGVWVDSWVTLRGNDTFVVHKPDAGGEDGRVD